VIVNSPQTAFLFLPLKNKKINQNGYLPKKTGKKKL